MGPVVDDLRDDVGGEARAAVQDICECGAMLFFVRADAAKKKEYDSVADEWVHQRVTESESDDDSVEALTVRTPLQ